MENRRNYYRILQVQPDAPLEVIRSSYRTLMHTLKQHPDLGGDNWKASILNEAYETLSDFRKRAIYDRKFLNEKPLRQSPLESPVEGMKNADCRRHVLRMKKSGELMYNTEWPVRSRKAAIIDLSTRGVRFRCNERLDHNAMIKLSSPVLEATAKISNTRAVKSDEITYYTVGAKFLTVLFKKPKGSFVSTTG